MPANPIDQRTNDLKLKQAVVPLSVKTAVEWDEVISNIEAADPPYSNGTITIAEDPDYLAMRNAFIGMAAALRGDNISPP